MIIKQNTDHAVLIPRVGGGIAIDLPPGYSEVPNADWEAARPNAKRILASGEIEEEWTKLDREALDSSIPASLVLDSDKKSETTKCLVPAKLSDLTRMGQKVTQVVRGTFHTPTLTKWYEEELRPDVRLEIQKQIDGIDSGAIKG